MTLDLHLPHRPTAFIVVLSITTMMLLAFDSSDTASSQWTHPEWTHLSSSNEQIPPPGPSHEQTMSLVLDVDMNSLNDFITCFK